MPRFYFDFDSDGVLCSDSEGSELRDPLTAMEEAIAALPDIVRNHWPLRYEGRRELITRVRDETGTYFFEGSLVLRGQWLPFPEPRAI